MATQLIPSLSLFIPVQSSYFYFSADDLPMHAHSSFEPPRHPQMALKIAVKRDLPISCEPE